MDKEETAILCDSVDKTILNLKAAVFDVLVGYKNGEVTKEELKEISKTMGDILDDMEAHE